MADQKPSAPPPAKPAAKEPPPPVLGDAAASTNPVVQQLLAHRAIAVSNGNDDAVKAVDAQLAELGVE
jgi:hypothetical protein